MSCDLFVFAGEKSGDLHGEKLLQALRAKSPHLKISGVGGPKMRSQGMDCLLSMEEFQVMGFIDVFLTLPKLIRQFYFIASEIKRLQPKVVIFIDYPGFNLRMAKHLRKKRFQGKLVHFICPSVWAWGKKRIPSMAENLDLLLSILPFEKELFKDTSLDVAYVGHPLIERLKNYSHNAYFSRDVGMGKKIMASFTFSGRISAEREVPDAAIFDEGIASAISEEKGAADGCLAAGRKLTGKVNEAKIIALFPGSRKKEIERNLPLYLEACRDLLIKQSGLQIALSVSEERYRPLILKILKTHGWHQDEILFVPAEDSYELMKAAYLAIAKSGTVTLELALHRVPTVVTYGVSFLDKIIAYDILRIRLPFYCLVNIIAQKEIFVELIGPHFTLDHLKERAKALFDESLRTKIQYDCDRLIEQLGDKVTAPEAAVKILQLFGI
jgi:lipid-A-disaccharide synthase